MSSTMTLKAGCCTVFNTVQQIRLAYVIYDDTEGWKKDVKYPTKLVIGIGPAI